MIITLNTPQEIILVQEVKNTVTEIEIIELVDSPRFKTVHAVTVQFAKILLWEGDGYDTIGQWTDTDVINRINELYN